MELKVPEGGFVQSLVIPSWSPDGRWLTISQPGEGGKSAVLRVSADGKEVVQTALEYPLNCKSGKWWVDNDITPTMAISRAGTFGNVEHFSETTHGPYEGVYAGDEVDYVATIHGRFGSAGVAGTFLVTATVKDAAGNVLDTCSSGNTTSQSDVGAIAFALSL
jgi:hypothetical protein